jgi:Mg2+ and Co2+ transporter CorA
MIRTTIVGNTLWIDAESPTRTELEQISSEHGIEIPISVLLDYAMQPSIKKIGRTSHTILRFPRKFSDATKTTLTSFEIDFICTDSVLLTIHDIPLFEIDRIQSLIENPDESISLTNHYDVYFSLIHECYNTVRTTLIDLGNTSEQLQASVFDSYDRKSIMNIAQSIRSIINIERSLRPHAAVFDRLETAFENLPKATMRHRDRIIDMSHEVTSQLTTTRDILIEMRWVHGALLTHQTNKLLIVFTMISFIALPLGLMTDLFGLVNHSIFTAYREPVLILLTLVMGAIMLFFHKSEWI